MVRTRITTVLATIAGGTWLLIGVSPVGGRASVVPVIVGLVTTFTSLVTWLEGKARPHVEQWPLYRAGADRRRCYG
jgi:hypothetical protein